MFDSQGRQLFRCRSCGYVDIICSMDGFWEKGTDGAGNDIYACNTCGSWGQVDPVTVEELRKAVAND